MDIKEIAKRIRKTNNSYMLSMSPDIASEFAEALIESYKAELLSEAGGPVACRYKDHNGRWCFMGKQYGNNEPLYTSDQVAAAILKATKPLGDKLAAAQEENERPPAIDAYETYIADDKESDPVERLRFFLSLALKGKDWLDVERFIKDVSDQFYKVEQRVAEACALQVATETKFHWLDAVRVAKEIRSGEWRKFVKEV